MVFTAGARLCLKYFSCQYAQKVSGFQFIAAIIGRSSDFRFKLSRLRLLRVSIPSSSTAFTIFVAFSSQPPPSVHEKEEGRIFADARSMHDKTSRSKREVAARAKDTSSCFILSSDRGHLMLNFPASVRFFSRFRGSDVVIYRQFHNHCPRTIFAQD